MSADFQADGRLLRVNDRVNRAETGSAKVAEQVLRTRELMSSDPVAESVKGYQKLLHLHKCKVVVGWVQRARSLAHKIWKQTQNLGIRPSHEWSQLWCHFNGGGAYSRDRLEKTPSGFRGGKPVCKFNLELGQMLFSGSPESRHALVADFV